MYPEDAMKAVVLGLYANKNISLSRTAELYGISLNEFWELLHTLPFPAGTYTKEMYEQVDKSLGTWLKQDSKDDEKEDNV
ncbi:UPF0175 family protein [Neobacillus cucumis]|uniref:UPF0175 family protein n=1 Tax=Neobacillus cucumis TaxID=1740721 RepID=UPI0035F2B651